MAISLRDLEWAAGFLEGEGSFQTRKNASNVVCPQVQRYPLDRLQKLFGGNVFLNRKKKKKHHSDLHMWSIGGPRARGLMMTLWPLMSPKRKEQIEKALNLWKNLVTTSAKFRQTCVHGHPYTDKNTYNNPYRKKGQRIGSLGTYRLCRTCNRISGNKFYQQNKERILAQRKEKRNAAN